ncbi:hypothetical protein NI826_27945, partial [Escherichia coli]|uniref:hypothetical protein n=1 Tax=Escherichia coli TaxID=562 RepID=UPI00209B82A5
MLAHTSDTGVSSSGNIPKAISIALQLEANILLAVTCQVDAAIGRIQGISAILRIDTHTICAVTCQVDVV